MTKLTYEEAVRADAVLKMKGEIMTVVLETMKDFQSDAPDKALSMIAASIVMAIESIDEAFETTAFSLVVKEMLKNKERKLQ